ncbi:hypothetical protein Aduo_014289 [Ancylostoma duodenale]
MTYRSKSRVRAQPLTTNKDCAGILEPIEALRAELESSRETWYLLSIVFPAEASTPVPNCQDILEKKWEAIPNHGIRMMLSAEVIDAKGQDNDPKYSCKLEELAYDLVNESGAATMDSDSVTYSVGSGTLNLINIVNSWEAQLKTMGQKHEFGCNFSIGGGYRIACVFK